MGFGVVWLELDGLFVMFNPFLLATELNQDDAKIVVGFRIFGLKTNGSSAKRSFK